MTGTADYHLGEVSERYESSGPGTISSGHGDHGGVSYGTYQLATATGTLDAYLKQSIYRDHFKGLAPNTKAFNEQWRALASKEPGFAQDQHDFIKATHYDPELAALKQDGLDLSDRGVAVQEAIWSTSVQYGRLSTSIFEHGLKDKFGANYRLAELTDKDIVEAVQDYKFAHVDTLFRSSGADVRASLRARAVSEKEDLVALADGRPLPDRRLVHHAALTLGAHGHLVRDLQKCLQQLGYLDAHGIDGRFGPNTEAAVKRFQHDYGLIVDGIAGEATRRHLRDHVQAREHVATELGCLRDSANTLRGFSDPGHPQHAMYSRLQELLPPGTSQARLHQATAACHLAGMRGPEDLAGIYGGESSIVFLSNTTSGHAAAMDLSQAAPSVQRTLEQVQMFDQHQAQQATRNLQQIPLHQPSPAPGL